MLDIKENLGVALRRLLLNTRIRMVCRQNGYNRAKPYSTYVGDEVKDKMIGGSSTCCCLSGMQFVVKKKS